MVGIDVGFLMLEVYLFCGYECFEVVGGVYGVFFF